MVCLACHVISNDNNNNNWHYVTGMTGMNMMNIVPQISGPGQEPAFTILRFQQRVGLQRVCKDIPFILSRAPDNSMIVAGLYLSGKPVQNNWGSFPHKSLATLNPIVRQPSTPCYHVVRKNFEMLYNMACIHVLNCFSYNSM